MEKKKLPTCPVGTICGGCQYQGTSYEKQLELKQKYEEKLLSSFGKVNQIKGMEYHYFYRNKVQVTFGRDYKGRIVYGNFVTSTHKIVQIKECQIASRISNAIFRTIRELVLSFKLSIFDEDRMEGFLRHVLVRTTRNEEEVMVVLVTGEQVFPNRRDFINALLRKHPQIVTVIQNVNRRRTSMILGERETVLYGKGYIIDELCGKQFRISSKSFYQVNYAQTEYLYNTAISLADIRKEDTVLDAYCGIGTIGMVMADHAGKVIGVELNKAAVNDARNNAKMNNVNNIEFVCADAGKYMQKAVRDKENIDVVIMDPPRAGADDKFLSSLVKLSPERIVYISCNPVTLKRDLTYLKKKSYEVKNIQPVDMFPFTDHVECIALLCRK